MLEIDAAERRQGRGDVAANPVGIGAANFLNRRLLLADLQGKQFAVSKIDAYITKPFEVSSVRTAVEQMLGVRLWSSTRPLTTQAEVV